MRSYATRLRHFASSPGPSSSAQQATKDLSITGKEPNMARRHRSPANSNSGSDIDSKRSSLEEHNLLIDEDTPGVAGIEHSHGTINGPPMYNTAQNHGGYHYHPRLMTVDREDPDGKPRRSFCRSWCEMWFLISKSRVTCIGLTLFLFGGGLLIILLTALGGLMNCPHLMGAAVFCFLMATLSIFLGFLCCCYHWVRNDEDLPFAIFCAAYGLLVLFICVAVAGTTVIFTHTDLVFHGDPPTTAAATDAVEVTSQCAMTGLPVAMLVVSYICTVIFLLMSYWACILALGATSDIEM